jgi:GAF domain-containing protein
LAENIIIDKQLPKEEKYKQLLPIIDSLIADEQDVIANIGNICAVLHYNMDGFYWTGVYFKKGIDLVLGPFQGPVACTRIRIPNGVCGAAAEQKETILVEDVNKFPGHIACSIYSKSEIVIPVIKDDEVTAVIDIDSDKLSNFDETDKKYLEIIAETITSMM